MNFTLPPRLRGFLCASAALAVGAGLGLLLPQPGKASSPTFQYPAGVWASYAPGRVQCGALKQADMNSTNDQAIPISVPSLTYMLDSITIANASISLTTAQGGFYTAASKGGTAVVANTQAYSTLTAAALDASGSAMTATLAAAGANNALDIQTLYFSLTTGQGAAATADIRIYCRPAF